MIKRHSRPKAHLALCLSNSYESAPGQDRLSRKALVTIFLPTLQRRAGMLRTGPTQPKGIGDLPLVARLGRQAENRTGPTQPKGIGDLVSASRALVVVDTGQDRLSRKALVTIRSLRPCLARPSPRTGPTQPKGIGDKWS